jgi:hypothetical protein
MRKASALPDSLPQYQQTFIFPLSFLNYSPTDCFFHEAGKKSLYCGCCLRAILYIDTFFQGFNEPGPAMFPYI